MDTENKRRLYKEEEVFGQMPTHISGWQRGLLSAFSKTVDIETHIRKGDADKTHTHTHTHTHTQRCRTVYFEPRQTQTGDLETRNHSSVD